jgi:transcriptional regulator with XRE-family HTH domain
MTISDLVRKLRLGLGDTQQDFAQRLQTAIRTVARWEAGHWPNNRTVAQLEQLARVHGFTDLADGFRTGLSKAIGTRLALVAEFDPRLNLPKTREEKILVHSFLLALRSQHHAKLASSLKQSLKPISDAAEQIVESLETEERLGNAVDLLLAGGTPPQEIASMLKVDADWVKWKHDELAVRGGRNDRDNNKTGA